MKKPFTAILAGLAASAGLPITAHAWCQLEEYPQQWEPTVQVIPVHLNEAMVEICAPFGGDGDCAGLDDVERTVRVAIDEYNDTAGANIRFQWGGLTEADPGEDLPGAVHIFPDPNSPPGRGEPSDTDGNDYADLCRVQINPDTSWVSMDTGSNTYGIHGTIIHELGHCLGFAHTDDEDISECGQDVQSVMQREAAEKSHLFNDDIVGLQAVYGLRSDSAELEWTVDGASWTLGPAGPSEAAEARSRYSLSNFGSQYTYMTYVRDAQTDRIRLATFDGNTWTYDGQVGHDQVKTNYHTATAASGGEIVVAYAADYDDTTGLQNVKYIRSEDGGDSWTSPALLSAEGDTTYNLGVTGSFDPESQLYVFLWRRGRGGEEYREELTQGILYPDGEVDRGNLFFQGSPLRSADSPSIACGEVEVVGEENCLLTWTTVSWSRFFYWVQGHVQCDSFAGGDCLFVFDEGQVYAHPAVVYGQASVAYTGYPDWPWIVVYHQGGTTAYTMRKQPTGGWDEPQIHNTSGLLVSPAAGSREWEGEPRGDIAWHGPAEDW